MPLNLASTPIIFLNSSSTSTTLPNFYLAIRALSKSSPYTPTNPFPALRFLPIFISYSSSSSTADLNPKNVCYILLDCRNYFLVSTVLLFISLNNLA